MMTLAENVPTVVFDIGNVLLRWDPRNLYRELFDDTEAMEAFLATACSHDWIIETDRADLASAVVQRAAAFPQYRDELLAFDTRWFETLGGAIEENVAAFAALKARRHKVYGLTNFASDTFERARPHYPFLDWFDGVIVSGREGIVKPDPRIYALLAARFALDASNLLFIDDSAHNIAAAAAVGWQTIHYGPGVDLAQEFLWRGLLA